MKFIDLFAGIGGMRIAFENAGAKCVFSCEIDKFCQQTYEVNFGDIPAGDIREIDVPDHDILLAGFPCQPFSIAGKKEGLYDTRGTLFFEIARIIKAKKPKMFLLENVKNLKSHDNGNTFRVILDALKEYDVHWQVIDSSGYVPQHRERIYIVGFDRPVKFEFPTCQNKMILGDILDSTADEKYTLGDKTWLSLRRHRMKHMKKGNGFGYNIAGDVSRCLTSRYYKDGAEILISQVGNPRRLTPRECSRLMGFPDDFIIPVSDTQAYKQFGNSVVVPLITAIACNMLSSVRV